jgi:hypothetical protein
MKLYNPFKAHIVQAGDKYFVRKFNFPIWVYKGRVPLDNKAIWWFVWEYVSKNAACTSLEEACALRDKQWVDPNKKPKVRVIHG